MFPLLLLAAHAATPFDIPKTEASVYQLDNGLRVVIERLDRTDTAALYLRYDVGSADEREKEHGCAHLFEHLMFEGSAHVPNNAFDEWLTAAGGDNNAWTSNDETVYHMTFPSGALDTALFLESDRAVDLATGLTPESLANQQDVVLQERERSYDSPHGRDTDALSKLLHPEGHPYHVPIIGTVADIRGFELDQVRDFWRRHYRPRNAVLVLVGPFDPDEAITRVAHWFDDVADTGPAEPHPSTDAEPTGPSDGFIHDRVHDRTLYMAWSSVPAQHDDAPALVLASYLLDDDAGTRLHEGWWRKPSLSGVGAWTDQDSRTGSFMVAAASPSIPLKTLRTRMLREMSDLAHNPVAQSDLDRAKIAVIGSNLSEIDTPEVRANVFMRCMVQFGEPNCLEREIARIEAVTPQSLSEAVARLLNTQPVHTLSVIPEGDKGAIAGASLVELP